jgi:hypothetical protein
MRPKINKQTNCTQDFARCWWLTPAILATQEVEIAVGSQPRKIVCETLSQKCPSQKRAGGVARGVDPEFKSK